MLTVHFCVGQDAPQLTDNQKAVVAFDFRIDKALAGAKSIGIDTTDIENQEMDDFFEGIPVSSLKRVFGAVSLPDDIGQAMQMGPRDDIPVEFFVRFMFTDSAATEQIAKNFSEQTKSVTIELNGETYWKPKSENDPQNILAHVVDDTTFEFVSKNYALQPNRKLFSPGLTETWKNVPDESVRIAFDLKGRADLIQQGVEMGKQQGGPQAEPFLDLIDNANALVISSDLEKDNLLTIVAHGVDDDQAEELRSGLDALLGMAKMFGQMGVGEIAQELPEAAEPAKAILNSLTATRDGTVVKIEIPKPTGFGEAVSAGIASAKAAAEESRRRNDFWQCTFAIHNYADAHRKFPFNVEGREGQNNDLSWRVRILPFMEHEALHDKMDESKGPGEEPNSQFADQMPMAYGSDGSLSIISAVVPPHPIENFMAIKDGSSNTMMLIENPAGQKWLENGGLNADEVVKLVTGLNDGDELLMAMYDGSVHSIGNNLDEQTLRNLVDPNDGNSVDLYPHDGMDAHGMDEHGHEHGHEHGMHDHEIDEQGMEDFGAGQDELKSIPGEFPSVEEDAFDPEFEGDAEAVPFGADGDPLMQEQDRP